MATITRGATTLHPVTVLGWSMTRPGRSVVHAIIGDSAPDITARAPGLRSGTLRTQWATYADALAASAALAVPGTSWVFTVPETPSLSMTAQVVGDIGEAAMTDAGTTWSVDIDVQETP